MLNYLAILVGLVSPDLTGAVAVEAAYTLHAQPQTVVAPVCKCGGTCRNGMIVHGDGHKTPCPCPADCRCKTKGAVIHPPATVRCENGTCAPRR
jgi:hypothetical protein